MDHALSSLFSELEAEHDDVVAPTFTGGGNPTVAHCDDVDRATTTFGARAQCSEVVSRQRACAENDPSPGPAELHHTSLECTSETPEQFWDSRGNTSSVDVATVARQAFLAERRKTGHARKSLRCPIPILLDRSESSSPPITVRPAVTKAVNKARATGFNLTAPTPCEQRSIHEAGYTACEVLPASKPAPAQAGQVTSNQHTVRKSDCKYSCDEEQSPHGHHTPDPISSAVPVLHAGLIEVERASEHGGICERGTPGTPAVCAGVPAANLQPSLMSRCAVAVDNSLRNGESGGTCGPFPSITTQETQPRQDPDDSVVAADLRGEPDSTRPCIESPRHMHVDVTSAGTQHVTAEDCKRLSENAIDYSEEVIQSGTSIVQADSPLEQSPNVADANQHSAKLDRSHSDACDAEPAAESPLQLEDSYTGSDSSEYCEGSAENANLDDGDSGGVSVASELNASCSKAAATHGSNVAAWIQLGMPWARYL
jgi:hypothetical protein